MAATRVLRKQREWMRFHCEALWELSLGQADAGLGTRPEGEAKSIEILGFRLAWNLRYRGSLQCRPRCAMMLSCTSCMTFMRVLLHLHFSTVPLNELKIWLENSGVAYQSFSSFFRWHHEETWWAVEALKLLQVNEWIPHTLAFLECPDQEHLPRL